ncbi:hypothetical protein NIIDNTM18_09000 [Mycolicibacterium litorale]|uniref:Uncharacterized protein n=1 Tax=Mycolicibacterium litorale TaxID=758802 RepID=A0A6S6P0F7_9MYCO|nr:hypothetical protein NIIDNTM18_09000 [Mycolicibacterium litorale]
MAPTAKDLWRNGSLDHHRRIDRNVRLGAGQHEDPVQRDRGGYLLRRDDSHWVIDESDDRR